MNKKGQFGNIIVFGVLLSVLALSVTISFIVVKQYANASAAAITEPVAQQIIIKGGNSFAAWDYGFIFLVAGTFVAMIVSAKRMRTDPIFFWVTILMLGIELFLVPIFSNVLNEVYNSSGVTQYVNVSTTFPMMSFITLNLPFIAAFLIFLFIVVFFAKPYSEGGTGEY
jgi:hypothetical protein